MSFTGIIAEYNPFHNGHRYQIETIRQTRPDTIIVCAMSGSFTQRGEAAILDKWTRAKLAVRGGVDLVVELPAVYAAGSAEDFAFGGISLFKQMQLIDTVAFGTETADFSALKAIAALITATDTQLSLKKYLKEGLSYAAALEEALNLDQTKKDILREPNNILALEYLKAIAKTSADITALPIKRHQAAYKDTTLQAEISSASAIRHALYAQTCPDQLLQSAVPPAVYETLLAAKAQGLPDMNNLFQLLRYKLFSTPPAVLQQTAGINEGLENRLQKAGKNSTAYNDLITKAYSKRYPQARIKRTLLYLLLQFTKKEHDTFLQTGPLYIRVLAFNSRGRELLHYLAHHGTLPIITKTSQFISEADLTAADLNPAKKMLVYDCQATNLRSLCLPKAEPPMQDFLKSAAYLS